MLRTPAPLIGALGVTMPSRYRHWHPDGAGLTPCAHPPAAFHFVKFRTHDNYPDAAGYDLNIFADYFQFVLMDESASDDFSTIWTDEALSRMLATGELAVCPGTLRNVEVQVEIVIWESEPSVNLDDHDHAVEASFKIPSGKLMVTSCTGYGPAAPRFSVSPGAYRMLFVVSGVETIQNEWEPADDKYTVHLWPGTSREPRLLKHWKRRDA